MKKIIPKKERWNMLFNNPIVKRKIIYRNENNFLLHNISCFLYISIKCTIYDVCNRLYFMNFE